MYLNQHTNIPEPKDYGWTNPIQKNELLFTIRSISYHTAQRRKYAASYSVSTLIGYEGFVDECGRILSQRFEELSGSNLVINLGEWMQYYALDVIRAITVCAHLYCFSDIEIFLDHFSKATSNRLTSDSSLKDSVSLTPVKTWAV